MKTNFNNTARLHTQDFTTGAITKPLVLFSLPLLIGNVLQQTYSITDSILVGKFLGSEALAAIGASNPILRLSNAMAIGVTLGLSVVISQFFGSHDEPQVKKTISTGFYFFTVFSIFLTVGGLLFAQILLELINTPETILSSATAYLRINFIGISTMIGYNFMNALFRGIGNSFYPLLFLVFSAAFNIVFDLLALIVFKMGVAGTAYATILAQGLSFFAAYILFQKQYPQYALHVKGNYFSWNLLKRCLGIGLPSGLKGSAYWLGNVLITTLVNSYGTVAIAAFSIATRIDAFIQSPLASLGNGLSSFVAQNAGAKNIERIKQGVRICQTIGFFFAFVISVSLFFWAKNLVELFVYDTNVISLGVLYLRISSCCYCIFALAEVVQGVAVGCGDTLILLVSTLSAMWLVRIPLAYILSSSRGILGIWISIPSGWFVSFIFCNGYYISNVWKKKILGQPRKRFFSKI